ncbi:MAG: 2-C-methyl-D-erythritol 4-phosphate cytidylyltransferase [Firmicutes bacterium]|nr:2-C-methyl-D-erythritol 4-phosphate cytidylyltransferase [Bacillota bacterium]
MVSVVIAAGGKGARMGADKNKVYLTLLGEEILLHTVKAFENTAEVDEIIVVTGSSDIERCQRLLGVCKKVKAVTEGGATRQQSVYNGILKTGGDIILIHDGARALITGEIITNVINDCVKYGAASAGVRVKDTLKTAENGFITGTVDRENTYQIQTPQAFYADIIKKAHENAAKNGYDFTDDCQAAEKIGVKIKITEGSYENIKITTPEDIVTAERILEKRRYK